MEMNISIAGAFLAGVVSVLSPCVLPVIPAYLAQLGAAAAGRRPVGATVICFFLGFTTVLLVMGYTVSFIGQLFMAYQELIRRLSGVIMIVMGGQLLGIFEFGALYREYRPLMGKAGGAGERLRAFVLGAAFTTGWTPCVGPVLSSILLYAGSAASVKVGIVLLLAYAAGFAIPFVLMAYGLQYYAGGLKAIGVFLPVIQKFAGVAVIVMGILLYFNLFGKLAVSLFQL